MSAMDDLLEGRHAVLDALESQVPVSSVLLADGVKDEKFAGKLLHLAYRSNVEVRTVPRSELDRLSDHGAHQGVMARIKPFHYVRFDDLLAAAEGRRDALVIVCDHVLDPGNLGAIARTAEVVGSSGLLIANKRAAQVTAVAYKSSAGALLHLPVAREANIVNCLRRAKDAGFWVLGASEHASCDIWSAPLDGRIVLVVGSEGGGLSHLVAETCDELVALPQVGVTESLNVAQATTAICYEWLRRTRAGEDA
jgi:23S rRNA (guanosine2251-2'-O)-methyltransferase